MSEAIRVWDLPIRLFHWMLAALFSFSWWSAETGKMDWHQLSGKTLLGVIAFRLIWGVIGSSTARFGQFITSPMRVLDYLRGKGSADRPGHNPLGGYSTVIMLLLLILQLGTGLFSVDEDGLESGPLSYLVSFDQGRSAAHYHHLSFNLLLMIVGLHVLAVLFYLVARKRNLIAPMISGCDSQLAAGSVPLIPASWLRFAVAAAIAAALAWWVHRGAPL